jgi:hypothetical protein
MGLFDQDIANSSKISDEDKAKYKAATDKANAKEAARYKSGPNRDDMTTRRVVAAKRARRAKRDASTMMDGGKVEGYKKGGKLEMVKKDGKSVPAFAADGVGEYGKMNMGGMMGYKKGGKIDGIATKGKTKGRMC